MHVQIIDILFVCLLVFLCGKSDKALVVDVDSKRIATSNECVDSQIEFESFVEKRIIDVGLYDAGPVPLDFSDIPMQIHERDCER